MDGSLLHVGEYLAASLAATYQIPSSIHIPYFYNQKMSAGIAKCPLGTWLRTTGVDFHMGFVAKCLSSIPDSSVNYLKDSEQVYLSCLCFKMIKITVTYLIVF